MAKEFFQQLRANFLDLAERYANRPIDVQWHSLAGQSELLALAENGEGLDWLTKWQGELPFDTVKRIVISQLFLPSRAGNDENWVRGLLTVPRSEMVFVAQKFAWEQPNQRLRQLSRRAGMLLPPSIRDELANYCPDSVRSNKETWWFALLFDLHDQSTLNGGQSHEPAIDNAFTASIDAIQRYFEGRLRIRPPYLGVEVVDPTSRVIQRNGRRVDFENNGKAWQLFSELFAAMDSGKSREELFKNIWNSNAVSSNNLDKQKAILERILEPIGLWVSPDKRGIWRLDDGS